MKKQETFTDIEYSFRKKKTKREEFLDNSRGRRSFDISIVYITGNVKKCAVGKYPKSEKPGGAGQAAVCACAHSRYFTGGSPSGLRV